MILKVGLTEDVSHLLKRNLTFITHPSSWWRRTLRDKKPKCYVRLSARHTHTNAAGSRSWDSARPNHLVILLRSFMSHLIFKSQIFWMRNLNQVAGLRHSLRWWSNTWDLRRHINELFLLFVHLHMRNKIQHVAVDIVYPSRTLLEGPWGGFALAFRVSDPIFLE
jgi:hypothetical protein